MIIVSVLVRMGCQVIQFTSVETFPQGGGVNPISSSYKKMHFLKLDAPYHLNYELGWSRNLV